MEGKKVGQYVGENLEILKLMDEGKIPKSALKQFLIYQRYLSVCYLPGKMDRYTITSELMNVSETIVRDAVREMEKIL